jgi:sugar lactone lactonase YvrE
MNRSKLFAVLAAAMTMLGGLSPARATDLLVSSSNTNQVLRYNGTTGVFINAFVPAGSGGLTTPAGLAFSPDAHFHVAAGAADAILRYDGMTGASIGTFATSGVDNPAGTAFGRDGHLYVASRGDHRVVRYDGATGAVLGDFVAAGSGGLTNPTGLAFGPDGHLYVASFGTHQVLRYDGTDGTLIGTIAGGGLNGPEGLAFGADGHLYVASFGTNSVLRYNVTTGAIINTFVATGSGLSALAGPVGLAFGLDGHLYVASSNNDKIQRYNKANGAFISTFVAAGSGGLDGPTYLLWNPVKVVDRNGGTDVYTTIQAAVNALPATGPGIIKVKPGTYPEAVTISRKNATALLESQRIVLMADPAALPGEVIVTPPAGKNTFTLEISRFITLKGFTMTGATKEAIFIRGGSAGNRDVTLEGNRLYHNGSASAAGIYGSTATNGGIYIGRENPRTWVVNNLIRANGRNGVLIDCGVEAAPKYFVNNTIVQNGFNGLFVGDSLKDEIFLVNNLIADNGKAPGTTGGRFGLLRESTAPGTGPGTRGLMILLNNMFYTSTGNDIGNVIQTLDDGDDGNFTTRGNEPAFCFGGAGGCPGAIAGCTFGDCGTAHSLAEIVDLVNFRLVASSPAIGAGAASLVHGGFERVPTDDFEGDPRPDLPDLPAIGFDEGP